PQPTGEVFGAGEGVEVRTQFRKEVVHVERPRPGTAVRSTPKIRWSSAGSAPPRSEAGSSAEDAAPVDAAVSGAGAEGVAAAGGSTAGGTRHHSCERTP